MLCFTACGSKKENLQYDKSTITQATDFLIEYCNSADADTIEQWNKMTDFQIESQLANGLNFKSYIKSCLVIVLKELIMLWLMW